MKYLSATFIILLSATAIASAQNSETRDLPAFDAIDLEGHARIYLYAGDAPSIKVVVKKDELLEKYRSEVRNGTLYLNFSRQNDNDHQVKLHITHTGIRKMDLDGLVRVYTEDPLKGPYFKMDADGFIKGDLELDVGDLEIDTDGFIGLRVSGRAQEAELRIDGFGKIDAKDLDVDRPQESSDGFAKVSY